MTGEQTELWRDRRLWLVFAFAAAIRIVILAYLFFNPIGMFADGDSNDYHKLAVSIIHHGTFSKEPLVPVDVPDPKQGVRVSYAAPLAPDEYRTPVYPGFLAAIYGLGGTPFTAVAVQSLLSLLLIWLTVVFAFRLFGTRSAILAGALAAVEPLSLIYSHEIMSDTPFVLMVMAATMTFMFMVLENESGSSIKLPLFSGVLMGLAVLVRPMATYLPFVFAVFAVLYLYFGKRALARVREPGELGAAPALPWKPLALRVGVFTVVGFLTISVWLIRNYVVFGRAFISTASDHVLFITAGSQIVSELEDPKGILTTQQFRDALEGKLIEQMEREGRNAASPPERAIYLRDWAINVFKAHPGRFALYMLKSATTLFVSDITGAYQLLGFTHEAKGGWGILFRAGPEAALSTYFGPRWPMWVAGLAPIILLDLAVYILALLGAVKLFRNGDYFLLIFFVLMIAYWTAASSVASMPRYRFPMMPFLTCLAAGAVFGPTRTRTGRQPVGPLPVLEGRAGEVKAG